MKNGSGMEYKDHILCVGYDDLVPDVMNYDCLRQMVYRKRVRPVVRGGGEGSVALIDYASLPCKYRKKFEELRGDPAELLKREELRERWQTDAAARAFFEAYRYEKNGVEVSMTDTQIEEHTVNATVLGLLLRAMNGRSALRKSLNATTAGGREAMARHSEQLRTVYGHTLPKSVCQLCRRVSAFRKDGYASVVSGKLGNSNRQKITGEFGRLLVALKRSRHPVYNDRQLLEEANRRAAENGWKTVRSLSHVKAWLNSPEVMPLWYDAVYGEQASRQKFNRKQRTELPSLRDSLWYGDGTKLNLYYRDGRGAVRTTQVYEVVDAMSEVLLGYHISDTEDYEAQYHAFRMAVQVSGHKPYEIVHDNQGGHRKLGSGGLFGRISVMHRPTMPYNGQSKTIENIFYRFQNEELHRDWAFTGQNITAVKESSRPNLEFVEANRDRLPTLSELKARYAEARKRWNEGRHPFYGCSRMEAYLNSENPDTPAVTPEDMVDMFWIFSERPTTFTDQGIVLTLKGRKYPYEVLSAPGVPDHEWRARNTWRRFVIAYDPYDLTGIRLYRKEKNGDLRFECTAGPYITVHRARQEQTAEDAAFLLREQEANLRDRIGRQVAAKDIEWEHGTAPEQHRLRSPKLKGVSAAVQREVDRRTNRYTLNPEEYELGKAAKKASLEDREAVARMNADITPDILPADEFRRRTMSKT